METQAKHGTISPSANEDLLNALNAFFDAPLYLREAIKKYEKNGCRFLFLLSQTKSFLREYKALEKKYAANILKFAKTNGIEV